MDSIAFRIVMSILAGALLGLERQMHRQPAGLKTHILICSGSTLLMILSLLLAGGIDVFENALSGAIRGVSVSGLFGDPGRLAAQVVSGIGFLGGGAIIRQGFNIKGLTTAATIWVAAAIGLAIGLGAYGAAIITLACVLITLFFLERYENRLFPPKNIKTLYLVYEDQDFDCARVQQELFAIRVIVDNMDVAKNMSSDRIKLSLQVHVNTHTDYASLSVALKKAGKLVRMELTSNEKPSR
jgi:putative Mg2+ transporter-C (MgtC) family protein